MVAENRYIATGYCILLINAIILMTPSVARKDDNDKDPQRIPTRCEVCKYLSSELNERLSESGKTHDVLSLSYRIDDDASRGKAKRKKYRDSETRLIEALDDPPVCDEILKYNVHAEREGSLRYAKGVSETMQTLHGLRDKGVKVELGIPYEMWDSPHAEITDMKRQCEAMKEEYEDVIEDWYFKHQQQSSLTSYLCERSVLSEGDMGCLSEVYNPDHNSKGDPGTIDDKDVATKDAKKKKKKKKKKKSSDEVSEDSSSLGREEL